MSKNTKSIPAQKGGPIGGKNEMKRTGKAPTPSNTGAGSKTTTPKTY